MVKYSDSYKYSHLTFDDLNFQFLTNNNTHAIYWNDELRLRWVKISWIYIHDMIIIISLFLVNATDDDDDDDGLFLTGPGRHVLCETVKAIAAEPCGHSLPSTIWRIP